MSEANATAYLGGRHGNPGEQTLAAFADVLHIPLERLRVAAGLPAHVGEPWVPPVEAARLDQDQRRVLDALVKVMARSSGEAVVGNAQHPAPIATPGPGAPTRDQLRWDQHAAALQAGPGRRLTDREVVATLGPRPLVDPEPGAEANPGRRRRRQGA